MNSPHPLIVDWRLWQVAARRADRTVTERIRVITLFTTESGCSPHTASPDDIIRWIGRHPEWSDATAATYHSYLRAWFKWLCLMDHRADNPMIKVGAPRYPELMPRPVSDDGLIRLLKSRMHHRTRVMILLASLAGMRVHEIAKVRGVDVDVAARTIYVEGKGGTRSTLPLHPLLVEAAATMPSRGWWFPANSRRPGQHIRSKGVSDIIGNAMRRAAVAGTPHKLRHWFGTTLLDDGADVRDVQTLLRHKLLTTTAIYLKVPDERRHAAINRLDPFRGGKIAS
jgi:site-specific recombinase XerD